MRFSRSTHLLMFLSLETLTSILRTGLPILVELIDLVHSVIIFLSQMTLLKWLSFLLGSQTVILIVLLFWIYFILLTLIFVLQWLSLYWEILIMLFSQFPLVSNSHWFSGFNVERNQAVRDQVGQAHIKNKCVRKRTLRTKAGKFIRPVIKENTTPVIATHQNNILLRCPAILNCIT